MGLAPRRLSTSFSRLEFVPKDPTYVLLKNLDKVWPSSNTVVLGRKINTATVNLMQKVTVKPFAPVTGFGGNYTYSYSISPSLPSGLSFNTSTGMISGRPTVISAIQTYTVTVASGAESITGTFTLLVATPTLAVEYFLIAGGGGGGSGATYQANGGGGAGGVLTGILSITADTAQTVTIGAGGANASKGSDSVFVSNTAYGGGAGLPVAAGQSANGGSGGGGQLGGGNLGYGVYPGSPYISSAIRQGYNGGQSAGWCAGFYGSHAGGGGAGGPGSNGGCGVVGAAGSGMINPIIGSTAGIFVAGDGPSWPTISTSFVADNNSTEYTTPGTYSWTCPAGVNSVCVVAIGGGAGGNGGFGYNGFPLGGAAGGGLGWKNNISVTPGQTYTVVVGAGGTASNMGTGGAGGNSYFINTSTVAGFGGAATINDTAGGVGGGFVGDGGGAGGNGGSCGTNFGGGGSGGAGGYSGNGGNGSASASSQNGLDGNGGGGGGGAGGAGYQTAGGAGGGVGIYGEYSSGTGGFFPANVGGSGSRGTAGTSSGGNTAGNPGVYGGGGATKAYQSSTPNPSAGGGGAVRIIWGAGRAFPSTNVSRYVDSVISTNGNYWLGGGGGSAGNPGGVGGGGGTSPATAGVANTGSGGNGAPTSGGSGVLILKISRGFNANFSAGITSTVSIYDGIWNIYTVTAGTGTVTFTAN